MRLSYFGGTKKYPFLALTILNIDLFYAKGLLMLLSTDSYYFLLRNLLKFDFIQNILWKNTLTWFFFPLLFSDRRQITETWKRGEILQKNQKKRMESYYGQKIIVIVILGIIFDLRSLHISITQTLLHGSSWTHEILISILCGKIVSLNNLGNWSTRY